MEALYQLSYSPEIVTPTYRNRSALTIAEDLLHSHADLAGD